MFGRKARRIETLQRQLAQALGIIGERDDEIQDLVEANANLDARNARIHHDLKAMRERLLPQLTPLAVDEDVTPYIPDYGVPATEDPTVLDYDPWKDQTR